jgi:hypothetical protein
VLRTPIILGRERGDAQIPVGFVRMVKTVAANAPVFEYLLDQLPPNLRCHHPLR